MPDCKLHSSFAAQVVRRKNVEMPCSLGRHAIEPLILEKGDGMEDQKARHLHMPAVPYGPCAIPYGPIQ